MRNAFKIITALVIALIMPVLALANEPAAEPDYRAQRITQLESEISRHRAEMNMMNQGSIEGHPRDHIRQLKFLNQEISLKNAEVTRLKMGTLTAKESLAELMHKIGLMGKSSGKGLRVVGPVMGVVTAGGIAKKFYDSKGTEIQEYGERGASAN